MKKWIALILAMMLLLSMAACGKSEETQSKQPEEQNVEDKDEVTVEEPVEEPMPEFKAEDFDRSGTCGTDAYWGFMEETGELTIWGSGAMEDYSWEFNDEKGANSPTAPWGSFDIEAIKIYGVTTIGECAFCYNSNLTSVEFWPSVTAIGTYAFFSCGLESVTIPGSVATIGDQAFSMCTKLSSVELGDGVTIIEENAFSVCSGLTTLKLPASVRTIESGAFFLCSKLKEVQYSGTEEQWNGVGGSGTEFSGAEILFNS